MLWNRGVFHACCWLLAACSRQTALPDTYPPAGEGVYAPLWFSMYLEQKPSMTFLPTAAARAELKPERAVGASQAGSAHGGVPALHPP